MAYVDRIGFVGPILVLVFFGKDDSTESQTALSFTFRKRLMRKSIGSTAQSSPRRGLTTTTREFVVYTSSSILLKQFRGCS